MLGTPGVVWKSGSSGTRPRLSSGGWRTGTPAALSRCATMLASRRLGWTAHCACGAAQTCLPPTRRSACESCEATSKSRTFVGLSVHADGLIASGSELGTAHVLNVSDGKAKVRQLIKDGCVTSRACNHSVGSGMTQLLATGCSDVNIFFYFFIYLFSSQHPPSILQLEVSTH
jgi:hypothetical protein